jgi:hypothetical protein
VSGFVPLNDQKRKTNRGFGEIWVTVRKMEIGVIGRPMMGGGGAEVPRWCGGGDGSDGWRWDLDFREFRQREMREKGGGAVRRGEKMGEKRRNSDLKGSHEKPKTHVIERIKCVLSHSC